MAVKLKFRVKKITSLNYFVCFGFSVLCMQTSCKARKSIKSDSSAKGVVSEEIKLNYKDWDFFFKVPNGSAELGSMEGLISAEELGVLIKLGGKRVNKTFTELEPCQKKPASWIMTGLRFAPYEVEVPGPKESAIAWAQSKSLKLDREIQLRLVFELKCVQEGLPDGMTDNTMHFVYNLTSASEPFRANLQQFIVNSLSKKDDAAQTSLETYATSLNTDAFKSKRQALIENWHEVLKARFQDNLSQKTLDNYRNSIESFVKKRGSTQDLENTDPSSVPSPFLKNPKSHLRTALSEFVKKHATKQNFIAVATMLTGDRGQEWHFQGISFPSPGTPPADVTANKIFTSFVEGGKLKLGSISVADSQSLADDNGKGTFKKVIPNDLALEKRFAEQIPFVTFPFKDFPESEAAATKMLNDEATLLEPLIMSKIFDQKFNTTTSLQCEQCHTAVNVTQLMANGKLGRFTAQTGENWNFHMMGTGGFGPELNLRTISETKHEALEANAELGGYTIPAGTQIEGEIEASAEPKASSFTCTTVDSSDSFILLRNSMEPTSPVRGSLNTGISLKISGDKSAQRYLVQHEAFIHKSVVKCKDSTCKKVTVNSNKDDIAAKDSTGKVHFKGSNIRVAPGGNAIGLVAPGIELGVTAISGDSFKILFSGVISSSRCR